MRRNRGQVMYMPKDGKVNKMPNPKTAEEIFAERIVELEAELAALKDKARWRKQSEEPAPDSLAIEIFDVTQVCVSSPRERGFYIPAFCYWRPLDLPEEGAE